MKNDIERELKDGVPTEVTQITLSSEGLLMHLKGHKMPFKGVPTAEAVQAVNQVKQMLMKGQFWGFKRKARALLLPHKLSVPKQTTFSRQFGLLIQSLTKDYEWAWIITHIFEYDGAYRFRLQDLFTATTKEKLKSNPQKEILRLLDLNRKRDYNDMSKKFRKAAYLLIILLALPGMKKRFRAALDSCNFAQLQFDENDRYWALQKTDYNYYGLSFKDRQEAFKLYE